MGHLHGPDSDQIRKAVRETDRKIEILYENFSDVYGNVEYIIWGDHGMANVDHYISAPEL